MLCPVCGASAQVGATTCAMCGAVLPAGASPGIPGETASHIGQKAVQQALQDPETETRPGGQQHAAEPQPIPALAPDLKPGSVWRGVVTGLVRTAESRPNSPMTTTLWTFRLETRDEAGRPTSFSPVELRGRSLRGVLADGDEIVLERTSSPGTSNSILLRNITTGGVVTRGPLTRPCDAGQAFQKTTLRLNSVDGVVAGLDARKEIEGLYGGQEGYQTAVWSFRIMARDPASGSEIAVPVELRATNEIKGVLRDGDRVEILEPWKFGETLTPRAISNRTTRAKITTDDPDARISARRHFYRVYVLFAVIAILLTIVLAFRI